MMPDLRYEQGWLLEKKYMTRGAKDQVDGTGWGRMGRNSRHAYFLIWNPFFSEKHTFSAFAFPPPPYFLSLREKKASLWGGPKNVIPGGSIYYLKHKHTIRSGFVAVIFS